MDVETFLSNHASDTLVRCFVRAIDAAESRSQFTTLAHFIDSLLTDESLVAKLPRDLLARVRGSLASSVTQLEVAATPGVFQFDLPQILDKSVAFARDAGVGS